ncbi:MAG: two-component system, OmpR family, sensor histidine kinase MtrB [Actinomycetota bacterium]|nr:two-component system, OmpR family, sensor histidine kinase MtrB [Actinomycetota bacterium]
MWRASRSTLLSAAGWMLYRWRSSLQLRVIASTMLLGLIVVLMLGSYLYQRIADGLVNDRVLTTRAEAASQTRAAQSRFDSAGRMDAVSLTQLAFDVVGQLASPGADQSRELILTRAKNNPGPASVPTVLSGDVGLPSMPASLRTAIAADPSHQQVQIISIPSTEGTTVPAAVVGSTVTLPAAGQYELYFVFPLEREQQTLHVVARTFALGGIVLVLLLGAVAYVVTRLVVEPVRRAALVAERLSSGRLHERMLAHGEDDIAKLGKSFNAMADSLQKQIRQLEDLSRVQQRFVSDVSHELRTPLTTIRMAGDLIHESRHEFDPSVSRSAELLHNEIDRFESLLSDLLEISRFDAGAAALDVEATDLRDTIGRTIESTSALASLRGSQLEVIPADGPCVAEIDPRRVERVLRNLVANAIEYGEGRPVTVRLGVNAKAVAVSVRDSGVGLRPGEAAMVFNRFWRADPARARTTGGTGLGLAISREDARLHGGWLHAWGEPGVGSCFRLTLPRHRGVPIETSPLPLRPQEARGINRLVPPSGGRRASDLAADSAAGLAADPTAGPAGPAGPVPAREASER